MQTNGPKTPTGSPAGSPGAKQSQYFAQLRSQGQASTQRSLPDLSPRRRRGPNDPLVKTPTCSPSGTPSPPRRVHHSPSAPLVLDSSFATLDSPAASPFATPVGSPFNSPRRGLSSTPGAPGTTGQPLGVIPNLSPLKRLRSLDPNLQRSPSEASVFSEHASPIVFESTREDAGYRQAPLDIFNQTISESPSPTRRQRQSTMPVEMEIIVNSRPTRNVHSLDTFDSQGYVEFWNLTESEGRTFKQWNKLEFERQNTAFEVFLHLRKIRFNLNRLVNVYGAHFESNPKFSKSDYDKTFGILKEFYNFLNRLVASKLKPLYDDNFIVPDAEILKLMRNWFRLLKSKYEYISGSIMYLTQLTSTPERKAWIKELAASDPDANNRSAVSCNELFSSYLIKLFTSVQLLFGRLKAIYAEMGDSYLENYAAQVEDLIKEINGISDSTSDLEKKISFNEKLSYKTDINYSYMEMVDMFNPKRVAGDPITVEMKTKLSWCDARVILFDNYLVALKVKANPLNLKDKDGYVSSTRPIPLQYIRMEYAEEGSYKVLRVTDGGNRAVFQFRRPNDFTSAVLDRFVKGVEAQVRELWKGLQGGVVLKPVCDGTFMGTGPQCSLEAIPQEFDPVSKLSRKKDVTAFGASLLAIEYFNRRDVTGHYQRYCVGGTSDGIYAGLANTPGSWKRLYGVSNVRAMALHDETLYALSERTLYEIPMEKIYNDYYARASSGLRAPTDSHLTNVSGFSLGYQADALGTGGIFLFVWDEKVVSYMDVSTMGAKWRQFRTNHRVMALHPVYANNFAVGQIVEEQAQWCVANLGELRFKSLVDFDVRDILRGETPVGVFKFPNAQEDVSETLVVYTNFAARFKSVMGRYKLSSMHMVWFGTECYSAAFSNEDKVLYVCGRESLEMYRLEENTGRKASLIGCLIGRGARLVNSQPGKVTLSMGWGDEEVVFRVRTQAETRGRASRHVSRASRS